jgi:hypothetical protein
VTRDPGDIHRTATPAEIIRQIRWLRGIVMRGY